MTVNTPGNAAATIEALTGEDEETLAAEALRELEEQESRRPVFVGHTRFSVFLPNSGAWVASNGSKMTEREYLEHLYSDERMEPRADIFFNYTLPMLAEASQDRFAFRHIASYSSNMPEKYKRQMQEAAERFPFLVLDEIPESGVGGLNIHKAARSILIDEGLPRTTPFGSLRLDDDDILSADYFDQMAQYITEAHVGYVVTLARGITAVYEDGQFYFARDAVFPLHSKGHMSICRYDEAGNILAPVGTAHNRSDRFNPVILDSRKFSHIWVRSISQDTALHQVEQGREGQLKRIYQDMETYPALTEAFEEAFPLIAGRIHKGKPGA
jgi:hypothetical protein